MKKSQSCIMLLLALLSLGLNLTYAQNIDWAFHAPGLTGQPIIPTVQNTIAKDDFGNIYMTSSVIDSTQFGPFVIHGTEIVGGVFTVATYLAKFNADGVVQWVQTFETSGGQLTIYDILTDANNNLILVGHASGTVYVDSISLSTNYNSGEMFLAKFDSDGSVLWATISNSQPGFSSAAGLSVAIAPSGDIVVAGIMDFHVFFGSVEIMTGDNLFLASYDENGGINWARPYGTVNPLQISSDVGVDANNNIYWVGSTSAGSSSDYSVFDTISFKPYAGSMFVSKYNANGNIEWLKHYGEDSLGFPDISSYNLAIDGSGVFITGQFTDTVDVDGILLAEPTTSGTHLFVAKFNETGDVQWARQSHGIADGVEMFDISINEPGDVFLCGRVSSSSGLSEFILGEGINIASVTINGIDNGFLAKYKANGDLDWMKGNSGFGISDVRAVVATGNNQAVINGIFTETVSIGDTSFTASPVMSSWNFYSAFCDGDLSTGTAILPTEQSKMKVFPNPADDQVYIQFEDVFDFSAVLLMDIQGRIIVERKNPNISETLVINNLSSGVYLILAKGINRNSAKLLIVQ
jgi:hypothetical protein